MVNLCHQRLLSLPVLRSSLGVQLLHRLALLFHPGVVLQIVPLIARPPGTFLDPIQLLAVEDAHQADRRLHLIHGAVRLIHLPHHRMVAINGVCQNRDDHVISAEAVPFCGLDGSQHVAHTRDAKGLSHQADALLRHAISINHGLPPRLFGEQLQPLLALDVVNAHDGVHVHHVVDPGDVLVADALDVVAAVAVPVDGRALDGLQTHDLVLWPPLLQAVPCGDGTS